jgi:branched-chain amino acid transport system permease protein
MTAVIITGLIQGLLYSLLGVSFVLIFKQSGVLNFAQGAIATLAVYVSFEIVSRDYPYWVAAVGGIACGAAFSALIEVVIVRRLRGQHHIQVAIAMLGMTLAIIGAVAKIWGGTALSMAAPFSREPVLTVADVSIDRNSLAILLTTSVLFGALFFVVERTEFGLAMRAANEGPVTSSLMGINVGRIQTIVWTLSGGLCAVAGLLVVPSLYIDPHVLTGFFIASLAVVVLGGLNSIGGVLAAGVLFGAVMSLFAYTITSRLSQTMSLVVILVVLAAFPNGIFGRSFPSMPEPPRVFARARRTSGQESHIMKGARRLGSLTGVRRMVSTRLVVLAVAGMAVLAPFGASDSALLALTLAAGYALATLGQNVLFGYAGLITVGQSGFMAVGAYGFAILGSEQYGFSPPVAVGLTLLAAVAVAAVLAVCVSRLSGVYLALATIAFALAIPELFSYFKDQSGGAAGIVVPSLGPLGPQLGNVTRAYYVTLFVVVSIGVLLHWLQRRPLGQAWFALKDSPRGAASVGINVAAKRLLANIVAGLLAAAAGIIVAANVGYLAPTSFTVWTSIYILAALIIGGTGSVLGAIVGTVIVFAIPSIYSEYSDVLDIGFGLLLVAVLMVRPQGLFNVGVRGSRSSEIDSGSVDIPLVESRATS